jgi:uncharacterized membrane protein
MRVNLEPLESRVMLDGSGLASQLPIVVGRTLSAFTVPAVQNNQVTITYTVYNEQASPETGVSLATTLEPSVTYSSASQTPGQSGQHLSWNLGTLGAYGQASVSVTVALANPVPLQLDSGAGATATLNSSQVSADTPPAALANQTIDPSLLASTPDASTTDPYIQEEAAKLSYDPKQIFNFLHTQIGYNSYVGSLRGARGTLWSSAGNSLDVASLGVALLRASGIPAQYAHGTLSDPLAQQLITSMFPEPLRVTGFLDPSEPTSNPASDPNLLAEATDHYWIQFDTGGGMQNADPLMPTASLGQSFTTADNTFAEVSDSLRDQVTLQLQRELTTPAEGLFLGGSAQDVATVLRTTFNTVDLVGKPITVGFLVQSHTLGSVFSATTNIYSPDLLVAGDSLAPNQDQTIRGTDISETLTNFPFGSQILTGLFLNINLSGPGGFSQSLTTTIADRIGAAARVSGGPISISAGASSLPLVTPVDLTTVNVLGGEESQLAVLRDNAQLADLTTAFQNQLTAIAALPAGAEHDTMLASAAGGLTDLLTAVSRERLAQIAAGSDTSTNYLADSALVKAYYDSPRVEVFHISSQQDATTGNSLHFSADLLRDAIRAIAFPGQVPSATFGFQMMRGISDTVVEAMALAPPTSQGPLVGATGVVSLFQAAQGQGIAIRFITPSDRAQVDLLGAPPNAVAEINQALDAGKWILTPTALVTVGTEHRLGWFEIDPQTGQTIGVLDDGTHGAFAEYAATLVSEGQNNPAEQFALGVLEATITEAGIIAIAKFLTWVYITGLGPTGFAPLDFVLAFKNNVLTMTKLVAAFIYKEIAVPTPAFAAGFLLGLGIGYKIANDPDVDGFLLSPAPLPDLESLTTGGALLSTKVVPDPQYQVRLGGAQLNSVFRLGIKNGGTTTETYQIAISGVASGFVGQSSVSTITIPAGETAEVGLALRPSGALPPPGTDASFTETVTPASAPTSAVTQSVPFTVPQIYGLSLQATPSTVETPAGTPATVQLTITSDSNVTQTVNFTTNVSSGLNLGGLANLVIQPGQTMTQSITLTPAAGLPANDELGALIQADFGGPLPELLSLPVRVIVPGVEGTAAAAAAARDAGNADLASRLDDLSIALTNLSEDPTSAVSRSQALADLDAVIGLLPADAFLAGSVASLTADRATLNAAVTAADVQAAATSLGNDLKTVANTLTAEANDNFTLSFVSNSQVAQPQAPIPFSLLLQNTGTQTATYTLSATGLPAGVTANLSTNSLTLAPGQITGSAGIPALVVTVTSTSASELDPFSFQVVASVQGASAITRTATASITARQESVAVVAVATNPTFTDPGGSVDVTARVLNAVNQSKQAQASYVVKDSGGNVIFTSTPVNFSLSVLTTLTTVDLGKLSTTGFTIGNDTIDVTITDASGQPIPGATGSGTLLIGSPVAATTSLSPDSLPAGSGTTTVTLQVNATPDGLAPLGLVGQTPITGGETNLAVLGTHAYVGVTGGIDIVDVSNPASPTVVSTFTSGIPSGQIPYLAIQGSNLIVRAESSSNGPPATVLIYSLANPANPQLLGQASIPSLSFVGAPQVVGDQVYLSSAWYRYHIFGGDIFEQFGELPSVNISNPAAPALNSIVYNLPPDPAHNENFPDGTSNLWQVAQASSNVLLVGSTTETGANVNGTGVVMIVDTSNPSNPTLAGTLPIPGMGQVIGIATFGNKALVVGPSKSWGTGLTGLTGSVVVATLDLTNPSAPTIISTQTLDRDARGIQGLLPLGDGRFIADSLGAFTGGSTNPPQILILDPTDPTNVKESVFSIPADLKGAFVSGNLLYTSSDSGLLIYNLNSAATIPVTAKVEVPNGTGVSVVSGSFSVAPTSITPGTGFDTLEWDLSLDSGTPSQTITWQESVTGLRPGESLPVTQGGTVNFTSQGTPGTVSVAPLAVSGQQILGLQPASQTVSPGQSASYTLQVFNPGTADVTYSLSLQGIPAGWSSLPSSVQVPAGGETDVPFALTSDPFAPQADDSFVISATAGGVTGLAQGDLVLAGAPVQPSAVAHGIVATIITNEDTAGWGTPAQFVVRLVNTGSASDTFAITASLPSGIASNFTQTTVVVPPGASNYRDVPFTLTPEVGTHPGSLAFTASATSTTMTAVSSTGSGKLNVLDQGVSVTIDPSSTAPGGTYHLTVTNQGMTTDTFDLALAGPAALVASLGTKQVTLKPGASQTVPITTSAVEFALPGPLDLTGLAASHSSPSVQAGASATLSIGSTTGMTAAFSPASQTLPVVGRTEFLLQVSNTGNTEDAYSAVITGASGPVIASLVGLDGVQTQSIARFLLPALATGGIPLDATLTAPGQATVTVKVTSLSTGQSTTLTASVTANGDGPKITSVKRYGIHMMPTTIVLTFDQPLDPALAQDVHEYRLTDPHGHVVPIKSVVYDPSTFTVTLSPSRRINFHDRFKLTVFGATAGGLASPLGLLLDGKNTGHPGSNYSVTLDRKNLVPPPRRDPKPRLKDLHHRTHPASKPKSHAIAVTHHPLLRRPPSFAADHIRQQIASNPKSVDAGTVALDRSYLAIDRKPSRTV